MSPRNEEQNQQIREERREQILQAAVQVFARKGLAAAKISDIAAAAGLSHGLVYHYFASKDEIFTELVKRALDVSLGIYEYWSQQPGTPWQKLWHMTETVVSGAYQGLSPYYFFIMIQAFTSDAVPETVKKLVAEKSDLYAKYLIPVIIEGQKAGQVVEDDPLLLATTYFALIQGLAVMQVQSGDGFFYPKTETILRLFQKGEAPPAEGNNKGERAGKFGPVKLVEGVLIYRSGTLSGGDHGRQRVIVTESLVDGIRAYRIDTLEDNGEKMTGLVRAENWRPLLIETFTVDGKKKATISYRNNEVTFDIPARKLRKTVKLRGDYYDFNTLSCLFRAYPFGAKEKIGFNLVMDGRQGSQVGTAFGMYVQEVGRETVEVPAGIFDCYKLEMGIGGMAGVFAAKYKYYFWYTAEEPHYLVKYEDKDGRFSELVEIES